MFGEYNKLKELYFAELVTQMGGTKKNVIKYVYEEQAYE